MSRNRSHHLVVGWVTGASRCLRLPLAHLLWVRQQVELHIGVWVGSVLQGLLQKPHTDKSKSEHLPTHNAATAIRAHKETNQSSDVHHHDEEFVVLVRDGQFDFAEFFPRSWRPRDLCNPKKDLSDPEQKTSNINKPNNTLRSGCGQTPAPESRIQSRMWAVETSGSAAPPGTLMILLFMDTSEEVLVRCIRTEPH